MGNSVTELLVVQHYGGLRSPGRWLSMLATDGLRIQNSRLSGVFLAPVFSVG